MYYTCKYVTLLEFSNFGDVQINNSTNIAFAYIFANNLSFEYLLLFANYACK